MDKEETYRKEEEKWDSVVDKHKNRLNQHLFVRSLLNPFDSDVHEKETLDHYSEVNEKEEVQIVHPVKYTKHVHTTSSTVRPLSRLCAFEGGCSSLIVSRKRCLKHGGGTRCKVPNCNRAGKLYKLCWAHGGYKLCKIDGCDKKAKVNGVCSTHAPQCHELNCVKAEVSNGRCWHHGGGKRCKTVGCQKVGYKKFNGFCNTHCSQIGIVPRKHKELG